MSDDHGPGGFAAGQLRSFVERLERVNEERDELANDLRDIYAEAKANGFDTKVLRHVIKVRAQDADKRSEFETIADLYMAALGMLPGEPVQAPSRARAPARTREEPVAGIPAAAAAAISADEVRRLQEEREQWSPPPKPPEVEPEMPAFLVRPKPASQPVPA